MIGTHHITRCCGMVVASLCGLRARQQPEMVINWVGKVTGQSTLRVAVQDLSETLTVYVLTVRGVICLASALELFRYTGLIVSPFSRLHT